MSLINEALKRARVEAARRDAAAKGVPPSALPVYVPRRRRPWLGPLAGFLAGLAAVVVAAGAFWLARGSAPAAAAPRAAAAPAPAESATIPAPVSEAHPPVPIGTPAVAHVAAPAPRPTPPRVAEPPPPAAEPRPPMTVVPPVPAPPGPRPSPPRTPQREPRPETTAGGIEAGRTYRVEATPAGGKKVKLDFIVWSETPFAQINGKQISPGQMVDGYKLLAVERERVELEHSGRGFWLRVR